MDLGNVLWILFVLAIGYVAHAFWPGPGRALGLG